MKLKKEDEMKVVENNQTKLKQEPNEQISVGKSHSSIDTFSVQSTYAQEVVSQNKTEKKEQIPLPIGICTVSRDGDNFEISIISNGKQYKFKVEGDSITEYWKSGMLEKKRYGV